MAKSYDYYDDWKNEVLQCPKCGWSGTFEEGLVDCYDELMDSSCPECDVFESPILAIVSHSTTGQAKANWDKLSDAEQVEVSLIEGLRADYEQKKLRDSSILPAIKQERFVLYWDFHYAGFASEMIIRHGEDVIFREPAVYEGYERFTEVAKLLIDRYGSALIDLIPTSRSECYLYGDRLSAGSIVEKARRELFCDKADS